MEHERHYFEKFKLVLYIMFWVLVAFFDPYRSQRSHVLFIFFMITFCVYIIYCQNKKYQTDLVKTSVKIIFLFVNSMIIFIGGTHFFEAEMSMHQMSPKQNVTLFQQTVILGHRELLDDVIDPLLNYMWSNPQYTTRHVVDVQIVAIFVFIILGGIISYSLWGKQSIFLASLLAFPLGVLIWSISGIIIVMLHIPYNIISQGILLGVFAGIIVLKNFRSFLRLNYCKVGIAILSLTLMGVYFACSRYTWISQDSVIKCKYGFMLFQEARPFSKMTDFAMYGLVEPFVHSLGYMLGGDYLYVIYPMFFVTTIGLMFCSIVMLLKSKANNGVIKENYVYIVLSFALGVGVLVFNFDFMHSIFWVMSHGLLATYFLMFIIFSVLGHKNIIYKYEWAILFSCVAVMIMRSEGIIYVLFLLTVLIGYNTSKEIIRLGWIVSSLCILWTMMQLLFYNGSSLDGTFFTPIKALILVPGCVAVILFFWLIKKHKLNSVLYNKYFIVYLLALLLAIGVTSMISAKSLVLGNTNVYISHFCSYIEEDNNNSFFWIYVLSFLVPLMALNSRTSQYSSCTILGYVFLVFWIMLFRAALPMRMGYGDSARRMLVHIMPMAIWLIFVNIIDALTIPKIQSEDERIMQSKI